MFVVLLASCGCCWPWVVFLIWPTTTEAVVGSDSTAVEMPVEAVVDTTTVDSTTVDTTVVE